MVRYAIYEYTQPANIAKCVSPLPLMLNLILILCHLYLDLASFACFRCFFRPFVNAFLCLEDRALNVLRYRKASAVPVPSVPVRVSYSSMKICKVYQPVTGFQTQLIIPTGIIKRCLRVSWVFFPLKYRVDPGKFVYRYILCIGTKSFHVIL